MLRHNEAERLMLDYIRADNHLNVSPVFVEQNGRMVSLAEAKRNCPCANCKGANNG
jgi:hypothetical protein